MGQMEPEPRGSEHAITIQITMMHCDECGVDGGILTQEDAEAFASDHEHASGQIKCLATVMEPEEFAGQRVELRWISSKR